MDIHTVNDLMLAAADALSERDYQKLERLITISQNWLQPAEESRAQAAMLQSMIDAIELIELAEV